MLRQAATYEEVCAAFEWPAPARYNIALDTCDKHADTAPDATALIHESEDGAATRYSFRAIQRLACRAANLFAAAGIRRGDRVGILLGQVPETLVTHLGCWRSGIVSLPLFTLFGEDALGYRLENSGARALVTDRENYAKVAAVRDRLPALEQVFLIDGAADGATDFPRGPGAGRRQPCRGGTPRPRIRRSWPTPPAPPGPPRARCTPTAPCSAISPASPCRTSFSAATTICAGRRPTGRGSAA